VYQVGAVAAFTRSAGAELSHVKAHGALYNLATRDRATAEAIVRGVKRVSSGLLVFALPGTLMIDAAQAVGLAVAVEGFADRAYEPDGSLRARRHDDAVLDDPAAVAAQALDLAQGRGVVARDGTRIDIQPHTLCVHGDRPGAAERARAARDALQAAGIALAPPRA
jgi:UPF0271 protein